MHAMTTPPPLYLRGKKSISVDEKKIAYKPMKLGDIMQTAAAAACAVPITFRVTLINYVRMHACCVKQCLNMKIVDYIK